MGMADLTGPRAKLGRADEHLRSIDAELRRVTMEQTESSYITFWRDESWYIVRADPLPPLPLRIALLAGDCLNNLRATLDHLVWQLVLREGQNPEGRQCFPLCETQAEFTKKVVLPSHRGNRHAPLYGIPPNGDAWALIEHAQPFHRPQPQEHPLAWVARFNNVDKHRTLLVRRAFLDVEALVQRVLWEPNLQPIQRKLSAPFVSAEHPTDIARLLFPEGTELRMYMEGDFPAQPTIGDGEADVSLSVLRHAADCIQQVLNQASALPRVQG